MYKELLKKVKQAKNCFAWVMINEDDGEYLLVSKKTVKQLLGTSVNNISPDKFVLRDCGDLYIN
jgi:hypothetical protein